jgi:hypothetical protein
MSSAPPAGSDTSGRSRRVTLISGLALIIVAAGVWLYFTTRSTEVVLRSPVYREMERAIAAVRLDDRLINVDIEVGPGEKSLVIVGEVAEAATRDELKRKLVDLGLESTLEWRVEVVK